MFPPQARPVEGTSESEEVKETLWKVVSATRRNVTGAFKSL